MTDLTSSLIDGQECKLAYYNTPMAVIFPCITSSSIPSPTIINTFYTLLALLPQSGPISNCTDPKRGKLIVSDAWHNPWGNLMYRRGMSLNQAGIKDLKRQYTFFCKVSRHFCPIRKDKINACKMLAILKKEENEIKLKQVIATHAMWKRALNPFTWSSLLVRSGKLKIKMLNWLAVGCMKALSGPIIIAS